MSLLKICLQNLRKWRTDYRIWTIGILALVMVWIYIDDVYRIAAGLGTKMPIWIYPFLYSQFHTKLIYTLPIVLLFCNAPFVDSNQLFIFMRTGRKKWLGGQILYIVFAGAIYYIFLIAATLLCTILSGGEVSLDWGNTLITASHTNAALLFGSPFVYTSPVVISFFQPLNAMWFTFLMSWLCGIMLGLIIFFCNILTGTKALGISITSLLIVLSALADNGFPNLLYVSPISWNTLDKIDVGGYTNNPTFAYCISVYLVLITLMIIGIFAFGKRQSLDTKG